MCVSDDLGFDCFAEGFWDLLDFINTVNLVDNMALFNWDSGIFNNWVVYAVFRYNFVARGSDSFFMGIYSWYMMVNRHQSQSSIRELANIPSVWVSDAFHYSLRKVEETISYLRLSFCNYEYMLNG